MSKHPYFSPNSSKEICLRLLDLEFIERKVNEEYLWIYFFLTLLFLYKFEIQTDIIVFDENYVKKIVKQNSIMRLENLASSLLHVW